MITIASNVDFFILSDGSLLFRKINFDDQSTELIEIEGEDVVDLARILPLIWENGMTISQFGDFFEGKYSEEQVLETVGSLFSCGIFSDEVMFKNDFLESFRLYQVDKERFIIRIDCYVYLILAESLSKAEIFAERVMCRWGMEDNLKLIRDAIRGSLQFFSARCLSLEMIFSMIDSLDFFSGKTIIEAQLYWTGEVFALKPLDSYQDARNVALERNEYWTEFIEKVLDSNLISNVKEAKVKEKTFELGKFLFVSSHVLPNIEGKAIHDFQVGLGDSRGEACGKALMESLERYCCEKKPANLLFARAVDFLSSLFVNPNQLARYLNSQLSRSKDLKNFSIVDEYFWTEISDINGRSYYIPASHIWYCFKQSDFSDGRSLFWSSTNGVAAHFSYEKAVFSAVQEIIERDAIMVWWLNRLSPPSLDRKALGEKLNDTIQKIENHGFEIKVLNLTLDLLPVCMIVARSRTKEWPYFFCGAACNGDFLVACEKALMEIGHAIWDRSERNISKIEAGDLYYPIDHELFYLNPENGKNLDFLFEGLTSYRILEPIILQSVQEIHDYLKVKGFNLFLKDITCSEIKNSGINMQVVKAVIPSLIPITFGYLSEPLALPRIYSLLYVLGNREKPMTEEEVLHNYQPHFFP